MFFQKEYQNFLKIKRPYYITSNFTRISNFRLGEWKYLINLIERQLIVKHKSTFFFYLITKFNFCFIGYNNSILSNTELSNLNLLHNGVLFKDSYNVLNKLFKIINLSFYIKQCNFLFFFNNLTNTSNNLITSLFLLKNNNLYLFDLCILYNFILPINKNSLFLLKHCLNYRKINFFQFFFFKVFFLNFFLLKSLFFNIVLVPVFLSLPN